MVEMSSAIKLQSSMETNHRGHVVLGDSLGRLLLGNVEVVDVGGVVLAVVELHDLGADDRLQGVVVVGKVGQAVLPSLADCGQGRGVEPEGLADDGVSEHFFSVVRSESSN